MCKYFSVYICLLVRVPVVTVLILDYEVTSFFQYRYDYNFRSFSDTNNHSCLGLLVPVPVKDMGVTSEYAKRQLERMGWTEGSGLGKERQGRATPILVQKRSDETGGLGIEKEKARIVKQTVQTEWWKDTLGDTLAKLSDSKKKKKRKLDSSTGSGLETTSSTKLIYTDEELFVATGGARFGMRAGITRNQAKWRRTEEQMNKPLKQKETSLEFVVERTDCISRNDVVESPKNVSVDSEREMDASEAAPEKSKKNKKKDKGSRSSDKLARQKSSGETVNPKKVKKPKKAR
jgi:Pin2-interacting protein X1